MSTENESRLVQLVKRLLEGDASAYNPLYDLLEGEGDPRAGKLKEAVIEIFNIAWVPQQLRSFLFPIERLFYIELMEAEGDSVHKRLQRMIDSANFGVSFSNQNVLSGEIRQYQIGSGIIGSVLGTAINGSPIVDSYTAHAALRKGTH